MEVKLRTEKQNPMLRRKEVTFEIEHEQAGKTPTRVEVKKAVANSLKVDESLVFLRKIETKTGTRVAIGVAHIYDTIDQAKLIEPEYIVKRNMPSEKPKEEVKT